MSNSNSSKMARDYKDSRDRLSNINWDEDKEMTLVRTIHQTGAHLKPGKWNDVLVSFLQRYTEYAPFDKTNLMRRLKRKYDAIKVECVKLLTDGNLSAQLSPTLTEKFKIMKIIVAQVEKDKETKQRDKDRREKMDCIEGEVLENGDEENSYSSDGDDFVDGGIRACGDSITSGKRKSLVSNTMVRPYHCHTIFHFINLLYYLLTLEIFLQKNQE
jgi:hypothetical protein